MSAQRFVRGRSARALAAAAATAALFFTAARWIGQAPVPAIWGGAVWVFLLATIVALPLATGGAHVATRGGRAIRRGQDRDTSTTVLVVAVWVCTLPVVFLLVAPLLGLRAAALTALALLGAMTAACWVMCMASGSNRRRAKEKRP